MNTLSIFELLSKEHHFVTLLFLLFAVGIHHLLPKNESYPEHDTWDGLGIIKKLTPEQIKSEPGFEHFSDEEVMNIIESNYKLSLIAYNYYKTINTGFYIAEDSEK